MGHRGGRLRLLLFTILLLIVSIICIYEHYTLLHKDDYTEEEQNSTTESTTEQYEFSKEEVQFISLANTETVATINQDEYVKVQDRISMDFDVGEAYLLAKIAMAEAEGESTEGKALVMLVVLNRVLSDDFPDTIGEVIFQHKGDSYQFTTVGSGRIYDNEPNEDCWDAIDLIQSGWDESEGALYFESSKSSDTWHSRNLDLLFTYGGHKFYK